jgi:hypothetical protein
MGLPPVALYLAWAVWQRRVPLRVGVAMGAALVVTLVPAAIAMLLTPAVSENTATTILLSVGDVVVRRGTILVAPFVAGAAAAEVRRWWRPLAATVAAGLVVNIVFANGFLGFAQGSYLGIFSTAHNVYRPYLGSSVFLPGAHYRVLTPNDRKEGLYYLVRAGAVLTSELFTESMFKRSFRPGAYRCFLRAKQVDYVVVEAAYFTQYHTNEGQLLRDLTDQGLARPVFRDSAGRYQVYDVRPLGAAPPATSLPPRTCFTRASSGLAASEG